MQEKCLPGFPGEASSFRSAFTAPTRTKRKTALPGAFVDWQREHATNVPGCAMLCTGVYCPCGSFAAYCAGIFTVTFTGQPIGGAVMPSAAAIPAAWIALNSRTRPGIKKHSMNPRNAVIPVQKKQQ